MRPIAVFILLLLMSCGLSFAGRPGRKKVVIVGEMSDAAFELATNASASSASQSNLDEEYDLPPSPIPPPVVRRPVRKRISRPSANGPGGLFVPVAAYSVTHSRRPTALGSPNRRMRPSTTESAVYGYVQKPDIVEFRGQYFYGPNSIPPSSSHHGHYLPSASSPYHRTHSVDWGDLHPSSSSVSRQSGKSGKSGLGPGGLLLATLPLILAPMLSYLFTPMVIPVTATIAAGRRRRRSTMAHVKYPYSRKMDQLTYHLHHLLFNST